MSDLLWFNKSHRAANSEDYESWKEGGVTPTLNVADSGDIYSTTLLVQAGAVRRLTPVEYERLQGFPDNHTAQRVELRPGKRQGQVVDQADSPRYKQMGNAVAVPVVERVLERLLAVDAALREQGAEVVELRRPIEDEPLTERGCAVCGNDIGTEEVCRDCLRLVDPDGIVLPPDLVRDVIALLRERAVAQDVPALMLWHRLTQEVGA